MAAKAAATISGAGAPAAFRSTVFISGLTGTTGVSTADRDRRRFLRSAQDDRRLRRADPIERPDAFGEEIVECGGVTNADLQHEAVFARDVVDLLDLRERDERGLGQRSTATLVRADEHEREQSEIDGSRIDVRVVAADGAALLELPDPLEDCGWRQADTPADLGVRDSGVRLERFEDGKGGLVDHAPNLANSRRIVNNTSNSPSIRLTYWALSSGFHVPANYVAMSTSSVTPSASAI